MIHTAFFTTIAEPFVSDLDAETTRKTIQATQQHYRILMAEAIANCVKTQGISTVLRAEPRFANFLDDWVKLFREELDHRFQYYEDKIAVLLDRYYPISAARRL